jgi:hypothetical protein
MGTIRSKSRIFAKKGVSMGTIELKSELISLIEKIEDKKVLSAIYVLLTNQIEAERQLIFGMNCRKV